MNREEPPADEQEQIAQRRAKLLELRASGNAFPNDFRRSALAGRLQAAHGAADPQALESARERVRIAGRLISRRIMGKASFAHLQDVSGAIQLYVRRDEVGEERYAAFKRLDLGDIVGVEGELFRTKSGELSVRVTEVALLAKAVRPPPEKYHGLADAETRHRQRYLDLLANERAREVFRLRSRIVAALRGFLTERDYLEVETPMLQPIPTGALARPFVTHHNALDMDLYLRIAPELYLKRLVVGGFERVFEINRNFRNEGLSTEHNPEFTMLEFYQAYADMDDIIALTGEMLREVAMRVLGTTEFEYAGGRYDFGRPIRRMTVEEAVAHHNPGVDPRSLRDADGLEALALRLGVPLDPHSGPGKRLIEIFEKTVEPRLLEPTFIVSYPTEVSPLSRRSDRDPFVADRFELFVAGIEIANGFSELNDPEEQAERFREQMKRRGAGDLEAMIYDEDYVHALEHGLPPCGGEGLGVDRLVMLLTDTRSIRDVILFPHMRPREGRAPEGQPG